MSLLNSATSLGQLAVFINAETTQFERQMKKAAESVEARAQEAERAAKRLATAGAAAFAAFAGASVYSFAQFDKAIVNSMSIMGNVSADLREELEKTARQISRQTTTSATQAAEAYYFLTSAGFDAELSMASLARVNQFAIAGNFNMARATDLLTDAQSALGLVAEDNAVTMANMTRLSDALARSSVLANATIEQFSESLTNKAGAALRNVNIDLEEGLAVLAAYADQGDKGVSAGERLGILLRDLQRSAIGNREVFKQFNVEVFDAAGNINNLADIVGDLERAFADSSPELQRIQLEMLGFQDRSVNAVLALMGTSEKIREYEAALRDAAGTTEEVANRQMQSLSARLLILRNRFTDLVLIQTGGMIASFFNPLIDFLIRTTNEVESLHKGLLGTVLVLGGVLSSIVALGLALKALILIKAAFIGSITLTTTALTAMFAVLTGPVALTVFGIAALTAAMVGFANSTEEGRKHVDRLADSVLRVWTAVKEGSGLTDALNILGMELLAAAARFGGGIIDALFIAGNVLRSTFVGLFREVSEYFGTRLHIVLLDVVKGIQDVWVRQARWNPFISPEDYAEMLRNTDRMTAEINAAQKAIAEGNKEAFEPMKVIMEEIARSAETDFAGSLSSFWTEKADAARVAMDRQLQAEKDLRSEQERTAEAARVHLDAMESNAARLLELQKEMDEWIISQRSSLELNIERIGKLNELIDAGIPGFEKYAAARERLLSGMGMNADNEFFAGYGESAAEDPFSRFLREENELTEHYERQLAIVRENEELLGETKNEILSKMEEEYNQKMQQYQIARQALILDSTQSLFENLADLSKHFVGEQSRLFKTLFAASKAFAIAEAIVKIQQGLASAASLPFPGNLAAMGTVLSATSGIVSSIQGTQMQSFEGGGFTGSGSRSGGVDGRGGFPAILHPNETVTDLTKGRSAGNQFKVIVNNYPGMEAEVEEKDEGRLIEITVKRTKQELSSDVRRGAGDFPRALESSYKNLRR